MVHHVALGQINSYSHLSACAHSRYLSSVSFSDHLWRVNYHSPAWFEITEELIAFIVFLNRHEHSNCLRMTARLYWYVNASERPYKFFFLSAATCAEKNQLGPAIGRHGPVSNFKRQVPNHRLLPLALFK